MAKAFSHEQGKDAEQKREELATLEGHDADIPTEDQTSTPAAVTPPEQPEAPQVAQSTPPETVHATPKPSSSALNGNDASSPEGSDLEKEMHVEKGLSEQPVDLEAGKGVSSVEKSETEEKVEPVDPNIVDWDGPDDPKNPVNWSERFKWGNIAVLASITFLTYV